MSHHHFIMTPPNRVSTNSLLFVVVCSILIGLPTISHAARILGFFPSTSKSHLLIHCSIADTLARAGHDVTVLGGIENVYKNAKYNYIRIGENNGFHQTLANDMVNNPEPIYKKFGSLLTQILESSNQTMFEPLMQKFLKEHGEGSFDLLIVGYFMNDFHFGLGAHFKCPIIMSFMVQPIHTINKYIGNPDEYSYVPTMFSGLKQPMNFMQRVKNYVSGLFDRYLIDHLVTSSNRAYYDQHFPSPRYPPLDVVMKNISLVFSNHHAHSQGPIRPNVPALIEIGGIQIKEKPDPLPADIAEILNNSKEGVIYFSFGSNVQGDLLSDRVAKAMFNTFSKLPYKVLWKWGDSDFPGSSPNIIYKSWLPQDDILAHPNVKLFITHAGAGSVVESQYHGVPMVAIPLFGDQHSNAANLVMSGYGVQTDYLTLTEESFRNAILEVLTNEKYSKAVQQFSKLYRDRPMTPRKLVVYWTEYVLRHGGAGHIRSPATDLNQFQLLSLDVLAFLAAVLGIVIFILVKCCCCLCCRKAKKTEYHKVSTKKSN